MCEDTVLCVANTNAGYFSIQSCAEGDESTQEYTQLNAFLLCVSDFG